MRLPEAGGGIVLRETGWGKGHGAQDPRLDVGGPRNPPCMSTGTGLTQMGERGQFLDGGVSGRRCPRGPREGGEYTGVDRQMLEDLFRESTVVPPLEGIIWEAVGVGGQGSPCSLGTSSLQSLTRPAQQYGDFPSASTPQGFPCRVSLDLPHLPGQQVRLLP